MTEYQDTVLQRYADKLYAMANSVVLAWALLMCLAIFLAALAMPSVVSERLGDAFGVSDAVLRGVAGGFGLVLGILIGLERSFMLRVRAQEVLCLRAIEMNTRAVARAASVVP